MVTTHFAIPTMISQGDADAVMFVLQDLPCIHVADVNLEQRSAWAEHSGFISPEEISAALEEAGYRATISAI
jgi:copper chaperone CopZ